MTFQEVMYIKTNFGKVIKFEREHIKKIQDGKWVMRGKFEFLSYPRLRDLFEYAKEKDLLIYIDNTGWIVFQ